MTEAEESRPAACSLLIITPLTPFFTSRASQGQARKLMLSLFVWSGRDKGATGP
jgi:hypothetical protein